MPERSSPVTRPSASAVTPCHWPVGASVSQLSRLVQREPPVALYSVTRANLSDTFTTIRAVAMRPVPDASTDIATDPGATAVTRPAALTVATDSSSERHEKSTPATGCSFASRACAVSWSVSSASTAA